MEMMTHLRVLEGPRVARRGILPKAQEMDHLEMDHLEIRDPLRTRPRFRTRRRTHEGTRPSHATPSSGSGEISQGAFCQIPQGLTPTSRPGCYKRHLHGSTPWPRFLITWRRTRRWEAKR